MRKIDKLEKPEILEKYGKDWLQAYKDDPKNSTKKYRYRHSDIKSTLKNETSDKCVYCESKIGHNTPGDIEHKIPSSKDINLHFNWENLTIACTECNRRKNDYYEQGTEFLDPYKDEVESLIEHRGPIVYWVTGEARAEISVKILELNSQNRSQLIFRKIEKIEEIQNILERKVRETNPALKIVLLKQLKEMANVSSEYSGMVASILESKGLTNKDR